MPLDNARGTLSEVEGCYAARQEFSGGTPSDDLTLLVLRGVAPVSARPGRAFPR